MIKYVFERAMPYAMALFVTAMGHRYKFNMIDDCGYTDLLNGLVTLDSIIIGFLGAVMPVILSLKNESKFVKYVFGKDKDDLFQKYLKVTVLLGILNAVTSLIMHVRMSLPKEWKMRIYFCWIFITVAFLAATYRCMSRMILLILAKDEDNRSNENCSKTQISESRSRELKEKYNSKKKK